MALRLAFRLTLPCASKVSVVASLQLTASCTLTLPAVPVVPLVFKMVTLPLCKLVPSWAPEMLPPLAMLKSTGSISQVPCWP